MDGGTGNYVRCTPIEYSFHDGKFWMFFEGGEKFIGLEKNEKVCLAIYDKYKGFGNLKSLQVMGRAEMLEPFSDVYKSHAEYNRWNDIILASADMVFAVNMILQPFLK